MRQFDDTGENLIDLEEEFDDTGENQVDFEEEFIETVETSVQWNTWRDTLAMQMYNEWQGHH